MIFETNLKNEAKLFRRTTARGNAISALDMSPERFDEGYENANCSIFFQEIKQLVRERTNEILQGAEKLQSRVTTLEMENRNLKYKVKTLYKAIRGALARQKEVRRQCCECSMK